MLPVILTPKERRSLRPRVVLLAVLIVAAAVVMAFRSNPSPSSWADPIVPPPGRPIGVAATSDVDRGVDSLRGALDGYRQRQADFDRGRVGCEALTAGYRPVDRGVMELAHAVRSSRDLQPDERDAFESAMEEADEADRAFDGTGCPRP